MPEIYVRVKQPEILLRTDYSIKARIEALSSAAKPNMDALRSFLRENWPQLVFSVSSLYPSLTIYTNNITHSDINDIVSKLKQSEFIDLVEIIN